MIEKKMASRASKSKGGQKNQLKETSFFKSFGYRYQGQMMKSNMCTSQPHLVATPDGFIYSQPGKVAAIVELMDSNCDDLQAYFNKTVGSRLLGIKLHRDKPNQNFSQSLRAGHRWASRCLA